MPNPKRYNFQLPSVKETHALYLPTLCQDREAAFAAVSRLYVQHVRILRNLEDCYDQIVHPQKRILLRQLLDCTIGRILELKVEFCTIVFGHAPSTTHHLVHGSPWVTLETNSHLFFKHEMVSLDNLEFSYHDETLSRMGISPSEIDLVIPKFVTRDRVEEIEYWTEQMTQAVGKMELSEREVREPHLLTKCHPPPNIFLTGRSALFLRQKLMKCRIAGSEERVSLSPTTMQHLLARVRETLIRLQHLMFS